jgi:hypothetical protein
MSAPMTIPFNHMPVSTVVGASGTYTVPAGKYAQVTISMRISMFISSGDYTGPLGYTVDEIGQPTPSGGEKTLQVMLKAGDVLSFSASSASAVTAPYSAAWSILAWISQATITASVNSVAISSARVLCGFSKSSGQQYSGHYVTMTPSVSSAFGFICSEYNAVS